MAKRKDETKEDVVTIVMWKGNRDVDATRMKMFAMTVAMRFVARVRGLELLEDDNTIIITVPEDGAGHGWVYDNVFRYVDILGATTDSQVDAKVEKLIERYAAQPDASPEKVGAGILIYLLNQYYLIQKSASVFRRSI